MKLAIVTGASGFIGRNLVRELASNGYAVKAVVRSKSSLAVDELPDVVDVVECEMDAMDQLCRYIDETPDVFFHFAWSGVAGNLNRDIEAQIRNIQWTLDALRIADEMGAKRFVGAGSIAEVEALVEMEREPLARATSGYKAAKLSAHYLCEDAAANMDIEVLWPRITNTYGAGERSPRLINTVIRKLLAGEIPELTTGEQLYNFIYISDCVRALRLIAESGKAGERYVVGSLDIRPLRDYLEELRDIVAPDIGLGFGQHSGIGTMLEHDDLYSQALYGDLGFESEINFADGIEMTKRDIVAQF